MFEPYHHRDRRQFERAELLDGAVQLQFKGETKSSGCLGCDISSGGIRVDLNDFVPLNTHLAMRVQLDSDKVMDCVGRVVWVEKLRFSDRYQAGLVFDKD